MILIVFVNHSCLLCKISSIFMQKNIYFTKVLTNKGSNQGEGKWHPDKETTFIYGLCEMTRFKLCVKTNGEELWKGRNNSFCIALFV